MEFPCALCSPVVRCRRMNVMKIGRAPPSAKCRRSPDRPPALTVASARPCRTPALLAFEPRQPGPERGLRQQRPAGPDGRQAIAHTTNRPGVFALVFNGAYRPIHGGGQCSHLASMRDPLFLSSRER